MSGGPQPAAGGGGGRCRCLAQALAWSSRVRAVARKRVRSPRCRGLPTRAAIRHTNTRRHASFRPVLAVTAFNEIGWRGYEQPVGYVRFPKKACAETKFLGEMAKAGLI